MTQKTNTSIKGLLGALSVLFLSATSFAQTGAVLARISTANVASISTGSDKKLQSTNVEINALIGQTKITEIKKAFPASRSRVLADVYEITCNCDETDLLQEVSKKSNIFQQPELAPTYTALYTPNDFSTSFTNDYALNLIGAQNAWDITKGDSSIVIAISDANFHLNHPELVGKYNYVSANSSTDYTHGTAVAITAAGNTNNAIGKSSIGYNSSLQLRAMNYNEILEASYSGARVVNLSWSAGCFFNTYAQEVIDEVYANGTVVIAAAGNGGTCGLPTNLVYPAAFNHVIAVSSVGPFDNHERTMGNASTTHQHNSSVDICAPGYDVALSINPTTYLTGNGTSFAAPYVSGTVALMLAVNPCLSPDDVETILKTSAVNIDALNPSYAGSLGAGRLDAAAAVLMASTYSTFEVTSTRSINCAAHTQSIALTVENGVAPYSVQWSTGAAGLTIDNLAAGTYQAIVRDSNRCIGAHVITLDTVMIITTESTVHNVLCKGQNTAAIELTVMGGKPTYSYNWSTGATTANIYNLTTGTYSLTVTDSVGCTKTEDFNISEPTVLTASFSQQNINATTAVGSINVTTVGGTAPYSYSWSTGAITEDLNELTIGFYEVGITDANGCATSVNTFIRDNALINLSEDFVQNELAQSNKDSGNETALSVEEQSTEMVTSIFPNPTSDNATIVWSDSDMKTVAVYTSVGQLVELIEVQGNMNTLNLSARPAGEYIVKMVNDQNQTTVKKLTFL